ncbi:MAG: aromatic ring-hydroxylating dioxygenase subunit alpha [Anaerolineae bacterium]|jgi:phenylpropionate dioxygenase-like ring-hydroxylating dioxygenase large terminal subunit
MIPNQWYVVMDSSQVGARPVGVTRMGEKLVFWRDDSGQVSCLRDRCAHRGVELSKGQVLHNGRLQCPFHGFEYDTSGRITRIPANGRNAPVPARFRVHSYPTHEAHDLIWIWWGDDPPEDLAPPRFFDDIDEDFTYGKAYDPWNAHYSRVIENQLDVVHLPFVHHNTIGRGNRTLVDGPGTEWVDDDMFYVYVFNRVDDGRAPRRPDEVPVPPPNQDLKLEFIFPNLWQNHIAEDTRIVAAFVPVDAEHTLLYLRFYQKFMRVPLLRDIVNWASMPFNLVIAHQDRRVVETQRPKPSALRIGEQLIQGDQPILAYRRRRQELMAAAQSSKNGGNES